MLILSCPHICVVTEKGSVPNALFCHYYKKWKKTIDNKGFAGGVLMDLSKAFDTHELLIAKLHAYGFGKESLMLLLSYLLNRWQRTKIHCLVLRRSYFKVCHKGQSIIIQYLLK